MGESENLFVSWTNRSLQDSLIIKKYLLKKFSQKEVNNFYRMLEVFEKIVLLFPTLYPISIKNKKVHRAVLSKQLSVFYTIAKNKISVVAVLDNRMSDTRWP